MRIMFVGDINLGEYYTSFGHGPKTRLIEHNILSSVSHILKKADIVCGNLEAPLTDYGLDNKNPESVVLRGRPKDVNILKGAGFSVLQVANNHIVQHGNQGFEDTINSLIKAGIEPIGLLDQDVTIIETNGVKVGFLAASDVPDNTNITQKKYQPLTRDFIEKAKFLSSSVDHLFVMLHWGLEASTTPMKYQKEIIRELAQSGVRGIIGSHPHLFYEVYFEGSTIAAPSLGNFIFDLCWDKRLLQSGILDIEINGTEIIAKVWPIELNESGSTPTPKDSPLSVNNRLQLYDLGQDMKGEQSRKLRYFFSNILKGNTALKVKFFIRKIIHQVVAQ